MLTDVNRLNRILGEHPEVGWIPDRYSEGKRLSRYRWMRTEELLYPAQDSTPHEQWQGFSLIYSPNGLPVATGPRYHMVRQYPEDRWCIAKWDAPMPYEQWVSRYGYELGWPKNGMWLITSLVFDESVEPTEALTRDVIAAISEKQLLNFNNYLNISQGIVDDAERRDEQLASDIIDSECFQWDSVPGKRGSSSVSWGGTDFKQTGA